MFIDFGARLQPTSQMKEFFQLLTDYFAIGYFLYYPLYYYVILLGTLILFSGLVMLIRFVRRYPHSATDAMGDNSNEKR